MRRRARSTVGWSLRGRVWFGSALFGWVLCDWVLSTGLLSTSHSLAEEAGPADAAMSDAALRIIPSDAAVAIAIRDIGQFTQRGDKFIDRTQIKVGLRLSDAYRLAVSFLKLNKGLNENGSAALFMMSTPRDLNLLVMSVPIGNVADVASNYSIPADELVDGRLIDRQSREGNKVDSWSRYALRDGDHLLIGGDAKSLESAHKSPSLAESLPQADRETLAEDDLLFYARAEANREAWASGLANLDRQVAGLSADELIALQDLKAVLAETDYAAVGVRLEDGLGIHVLLQFDGERSRELLGRLRSDGAARASLAGLPRGPAMIAQATGRGGEESSAMARVLVHATLAQSPLGPSPLLAARYRPLVVSLFGELWQRVQGSRMAVYENADPERLGLCSVITILDTENADQLLVDMSELARFANAANSAGEEGGISAATIDSLIADLGHAEYRRRQLASTKLTFVGPPALTAVERAAKSPDAEIRLRATAIRDRIQWMLSEQRVEFVTGELLTRARPKFVYLPDQESRRGRAIDVVRIQIDGERSGLGSGLRHFLGPSWNEVRLATIDNRIVLLLGSDTELFEQAIDDVTKNRPGLAEQQATALHSPLDIPYTAEFHGSAERLQAWLAGDGKPVGPNIAAVTSVRLQVAPQRVQLRMFAPYADVRTVVQIFESSRRR